MHLVHSASKMPCAPGCLRTLPGTPSQCSFPWRFDFVYINFNRIYIIMTCSFCIQNAGLTALFWCLVHVICPQVSFPQETCSNSSLPRLSGGRLYPPVSSTELYGLFCSKGNPHTVTFFFFFFYRGKYCIKSLLWNYNFQEYIGWKGVGKIVDR